MGVWDRFGGIYGFFASLFFDARSVHVVLDGAAGARGAIWEAEQLVAIAEAGLDWAG